MKKYSIIFSSLLLISIGACKNTEQLSQNTPKEVVEEEIIELDTLNIISNEVEKSPNEEYSLPVYRASFEREIDLLHTKLDLSFDFEKEWVKGKSWLHITPIFDRVDQISLDAQHFYIHEIKDQSGRTLDYTYEDSLKLIVQLQEPLEREEKLVLYIDYTARPGAGGVGGSAAIMSDKGLFFIDPRDEDPYTPTQIWTQGETEHNSNWFPTVDKPNERCTQELALTVPNEMETMSNGAFLKSENLRNNMRKDYYKLDQPHAPYLFALVVGDFAVVEDKWKDIPLKYYVEKDYEPYAPEIFDHTPEMLSFFSNILDYPYPWPKYDQAIVREYVSGAMENTTSVIFGDFVQKSDLDLVDNDNDFIVAHEMFHHWFGDLVTCESWSNLTMNEGFANYSEYLWMEYKDGKDRADKHREKELATYIQTAKSFKHPLIYFEYQQAEQMFDAHSYNKGGLVLHMLRDYLGDEKFFAGLHEFLEEHKYTAVEAHDLRLSMEDISGEDLNWFFNQWYFEAGHPELDIEHSWNDGELSVQIQQTQNPEKNPAIFILPASIDVFDQNGVRERIDFVIDERLETIKLETNQAPSLVIFDPEDILLAEISHKKTDEELALQYDYNKTYKYRNEAVERLAYKNQEIAIKALQDPFYSIRKFAISKLKKESVLTQQHKLKQLLQKDPSSIVRSEVIKKLAEYEEDLDFELLPLIKSRLEAKEAGIELGQAISTLYNLDSAQGVQWAERMQDINSDIFKNSIMDIYAQTGNPKYIGFFDKLLPKQSGFQSFPFYANYANMVSKLDKNAIIERTDKLHKMAVDQSKGMFSRFALTKCISDIRNNLSPSEHGETIEKLTQKIEDIKSKETSDRLKSMYNSF